MMDGNDDDNNNNDDENHQDQQQQIVDIDDEDGEENDSDDESDDASVVAADTMIVRSNRRAKLLSLLEQYNACPSRTRNNIDDLVAKALEKAEDDAHEMICDQNVGDDYRGLDINRDTIKEVETIVRIFPNTLSKRKETKWRTNEEGVEGWVATTHEEGNLPIQCILAVYGPEGIRYNLKAFPFLSDLARLGTELNQFEEEERGGLFIDNFNILRRLVVDLSQEYNQRVENVCQSQFIQLQRMGLFMEGDIPRYELVHNSFSHDHFAINTFQFLVEWCPTSLVHTNEYGRLPLHIAAQSTIQAFRIVFEHVIRYYPNKKGITMLFITTNSRSDDGRTPFENACMKHGRDAVMTIVEDTLNNSVIPLNIVEALFLAVSNEEIELDCVYFLLRRAPHVWVRLLSAPHNNNNNNNDDDDGGDGSEDDHDGDDDDDNHDYQQNVEQHRQIANIDEIENEDEDENENKDEEEDSDDDSTLSFHSQQVPSSNDGDNDVDDSNEGHDNNHVDDEEDNDNDNDNDNNNDIDDNEDMNNGEGDDDDDDDVTNGATAAVAAADNDDRNYNTSDIVRNNMNRDKGEGVEEGDGDDDEMGEGTHNNDVVSRKRKR